MKAITLLILFFLCTQLQAQKSNPKYDEALATKLGADDYGMKSYVLVLLKTGSNDSKDENARQKAFQGHMANMNIMVENEQLVVAGPIEDNEKDYRGIFILNAKSIEEARMILQTDPAIKANYLEAELYNWYGSAALSEYLEASDKIWKIGF